MAQQTTTTRTTSPIVLDEPAPKPDGPLSAALIAAGIGSIVLGLLTTGAVISDSLNEDLRLNDDVGPLSGKTVFATAAFIVAWLVSHYALRGKDGFLRTATIIFIVLTVLGYIGTFPTFFEGFE